MEHLTKSSGTVRTATAILVAAILTIGAVPAGAQSSPQGGAEMVRGFYAVLLSTMKSGTALGPSGRYARLEPAVRQSFDIPFMTRVAVGPGWTALSAAEQQRASEAFERYISATYADRFDDYSGEQLQVVGETQAGGGAVVQTRIIKSNGEPVSISYLLRHNGGAWQIADVYLDGTISELATRRSEFASILRDRGIGGLIAALNQKADLLSAKSARAG